LRRAADEQAPAPPRAELLFTLGGCEMAVRDPAVVAHLQEAHELATDPALRARIAATRAELCFANGQWDAGVALMGAARDELGAGEPELVTEMEAIRAWAAAFDPQLVRAFDDNYPRLEVLARGDSWAAAALSGLLAGVAAIRSDPARDAVALAEQSWRSGALLQRGCGGWATAQVLTALALSEELDRTVEIAEAVEREGKRQGSVIAMLCGAGFRGYVALRRGDLLDAEVSVRTSMRTPVRLALAAHAEMWIASGPHLFLDAMLERPSLDDMEATIEGLRIDDGLMATVIGAMLLETRGRARRRRGDHAGALADLRACAHTNRLLHVGPMHSPWRSELALALPADEQDEAMALIDDELTVARRSGYARAVGVALRAAGVRQGGDDGIDVLRESVAMLEGTPARLELARSLVALGAALRRRQLRTDAREPLTRGMELAHRCGATRLVDSADEELHAAGARPRRPVQTGADALTASELRVARLAGQDRSNLEIAQELYVSRKTVETHLSHAYAKLGLAGQGARRGLAAALGESV
jgi:DNA-binding CsgD family transcriptional regulator